MLEAWDRYCAENPDQPAAETDGEWLDDDALSEVLHSTIALQTETHTGLVEARQALADLVAILDDVGGFLWPEQQQALWRAKELLKEKSNPVVSCR
jgi:hypothetical protein